MSVTLVLNSFSQSADECFICDGSSKVEFDKIIAKWVLNESDGETKTTHPWKVSETDLWSQRDKVCVVVKL